MNKSNLFSLLGFVAFGSQAVVAAMIPEFVHIASVIAILISFTCGYIHASASNFFKGMMVAMVCWTLWAIITGSRYDRIMALIMIPLVILWKLSAAALSFYLGKLLNAGINKLRRLN
jgi:hypothetical protein